MPIYIPSDISKKLMEISGGDFNHPVINSFCHHVTKEMIRQETIRTIKWTALVILIIAIPIVLGIYFG